MDIRDNLKPPKHKALVEEAFNTIEEIISTNGGHVEAASKEKLRLHLQRMYSHVGSWIKERQELRQHNLHLATVHAASETESRYLQALNRMHEAFLGYASHTPFQEFVDIVGKSAHASRTYVFINHQTKDGDERTSQVAEYCAPGVAPQLENPILQNLSYQKQLPYTGKVLRGEGLINSPVGDLPEAEQKILLAEGIQAILLIPVHIEGEFWGFVGFDNCINTQLWEPVEVNYLKTAAQALQQKIRLTRSQQELAIKEERYALVLAAKEDGLWDWDLTTGKVYFDPRYYTLAGYTPDEFPASYESFRERVHPEDIPALEKRLQDYKEGKVKDYDVEFRLRHKQGHWMWVRAKGRFVAFAPDGSPTRMVGSHSDITPRKVAEIAQAESEKELRELNATKDLFFSIVAHDLKNPLSNIMGFARLLQKQHWDAPAEEREKKIQVVLKNAARTYGLLENLLHWSRLQRGKIELYPETLPLKSQALKTLALVQDNAKHKDIRIQATIPDHLRVQADANMLDTILRNLLTNAIKFTPKGGQVKLTAKTAANGEKPVAEICVEDNGIGIKPSRLETLFHIGSGNSTPGTNKEKGTGLGLILVREFVEKQGGKIQAHSVPGQGTRILFTLPVVS